MVSKDRVLTRSNNGFISGTLKGLANYYGLRLGRLRLFFVILLFFGIGLFLYLALWACIPSYAQRDYLLEKLRTQQDEMNNDIL